MENPILSPAEDLAAPVAARDAVDRESMTWAETRRLIRSDFARLLEWYGGGSFVKQVYWFCLPNYQALFAYRIARFLFLRGWSGLARLISLHALYATGVEISPTASIGPGCLIVHAFGIIVFGKLGARCSLFGQCGTGGGLGAKVVDGTLGQYPVVGDDVIFGMKAMVLGPVHIGNRVKLGPAAFVTRDVPDDALVVTLPSKIVKVRLNAQEASAEPDVGENLGTQAPGG